MWIRVLMNAAMNMKQFVRSYVVGDLAREVAGQAVCMYNCDPL